MIISLATRGDNEYDPTHFHFRAVAIEALSKPRLTCGTLKMCLIYQPWIFVFAHRHVLMHALSSAFFSVRSVACSVFQNAVKRWAQDGSWIKVLKSFNIDFTEIWFDSIIP